MIINVKYQYIINWNQEKQLVIIEGPFSNDDPKMNLFADTPLCFNGVTFYDSDEDGLEYEESCIDSSVLEYAKDLYSKKNK